MPLPWQKIKLVIGMDIKKHSVSLHEEHTDLVVPSLCRLGHGPSKNDFTQWPLNMSVYARHGEPLSIFLFFRIFQLILYKRLNHFKASDDSISPLEKFFRIPKITLWPVKSSSNPPGLGKLQNENILYFSCASMSHPVDLRRAVGDNYIPCLWVKL